MSRVQEWSLQVERELRGRPRGPHGSCGQWACRGWAARTRGPVLGLCLAGLVGLATAHGYARNIPQAWSRQRPSRLGETDARCRLRRVHHVAGACGSSMRQGHRLRARLRGNLWGRQRRAGLRAAQPASGAQRIRMRQPTCGSASLIQRPASCRPGVLEGVAPAIEPAWQGRVTRTRGLRRTDRLRGLARSAPIRHRPALQCGD